MGKATALCDRVLRTLWRHSPVSASFLGIHDYDHLLSALDADALAGKRKELKDHLREIEGLRREDPPLTEDERLDLELIERDLRTLIRSDEEIRVPFRNPGSYLEEVTFGVYILMQRDFAPLEERARLAAARLSAVPRVLEEARRNLSNPSEVPRIWASMAGDLTSSAQQFFEEMVAVVGQRAPTVRSEFQRAAEGAREAVKTYAAFLETDIHPRARGSYAVGEEMLNFLLRVPHGLPYSVAELEDFGLSEIERTLRLLKETAAELGAERSWAELLESFRDDAPPPERVLSVYREEIDRTRQFVRDRDLLTFPPGERLQIVETPVFERKTTPFAAYIPPAPFEEKQEGYFWVTPPLAALPSGEAVRPSRGHALPGIPITCVHEGYPGHHLQISLANRVSSKPRRQIWTPVLVEGWALYCEEMMGELGYYRDSRTRLVQLRDHLWRSCRVVIDLGLHTEKTSFEEAVGMLVNVARLEPADATGEVKRYTKTPTQPLSYAVGKREILRLREETRAAEGPGFSLRRFHDRILQFGSIPISLIRERLGAPPQA